MTSSLRNPPRRRELVLTVAAMLFGLACGRDEPPPAVATAPMPAAAPVDPDDPRTCVSCHATVVQEWEQSMHSRAHESRDPIFAGMRRARMKREGPEIAKACAQCHYPRDAAMTKPEVAERGVVCSSCHLAAELHHERGPGAKAIVWSEGVMAGPHDLAAGLSPAHGSGPAPDFMKDGSSLCLTCHAAASNPQGVASCTTGLEWQHGKGDSCVSCHMPQTDGPSGAVSAARAQHRSHQFLGPHRAWLQDDPSVLASAVELSARFVDVAVVVTLANLSQHGFPSGFPGRMAAVVAVGRDASGAEVWRSAPAGNLTEAPQALLRKVYVDAQGKPVPAAMATELQLDSRLSNGERREIRFEGVGAEVAAVQVVLQYFLLPPPLAAKLGVEGDEAEPKVVARVSIQR
ncbi:MAG: multiheme c-type cytochrome [Nannocystaceae bacterium]